MGKRANNGKRQESSHCTFKLAGGWVEDYGVRVWMGLISEASFR